MSILQNAPHLLERAYVLARGSLRPLQHLLRPGGGVERLFIWGERLSKGPLFDCQMCGECVLHLTGMTCPMTCPKNMRNGPCGGVRPDGKCEILPDQPCIWTQAWGRAERMPRFGAAIRRILPPLDRRLQGTSSWVNDFGGRIVPPAGWDR